jgi:tetratricopeptide (TPR) repeat protein
MNELSAPERETILGLLRLGWSIRRVARETGRRVGVRRVFGVGGTHLDFADWRRYFNTVLGLVIATSAGELLGQSEGHYIVDKLAPFVERTRSLVDGVRQMDSATQAELSTLLANALATVGQQSGNNAALMEAVRRYHTALSSSRRESAPLDWALTQNNLGNALERLGERESRTARLQEALTAYQNALQERTRERVPRSTGRRPKPISASR